MVELRIVREALEALADSPSRVGVTRYSAETAAEDGGTGANLTIVRASVEVMADRDPEMRVTRMDHEVAAEDGGTGADLTVLRQAGEIIINVPTTVGVTRYGAETAGADGGTGADLTVLRQAIEVIGNVGVTPPVPLPLAATVDFFINNWASVVDMESSYRTDITRSPFTLTEERLSRQQRAQRVINYRWTRDSLAEYDRMVVFLRRLTDENLQGLLFQDFANVTQAQGVSDAFIHCDAQHKRFFPGQRILVSKMPGGFQAHATVETLTILAVSSTLIRTTTVPSQVFDPADNWTVFPIIDCEKKLEAEQTDETTETVDLGIELFEFRGPSALPPTTVGLPDGWKVAFGLPIWEIEPNWVNGVPRGYKRYGSMLQQGRATRPKVEGDRYAQTQRYDLLLDRPDFWRVINFFDSRRGRSLAFWAVDREFVWEVIDTDPSFIDITPFQDFADFNEIWTENSSGAGIVMKDGTIHIVHINTVQDVGGVWRLTLAAGETLPDPIDVSQIDRFARARTTRFAKDSLTERWETSEAVRVNLSTIETINEQDVDFTA